MPGARLSSGLGISARRVWDESAGSAPDPSPAPDSSRHTAKWEALAQPLAFSLLALHTLPRPPTRMAFCCTSSPRIHVRCASPGPMPYTAAGPCIGMKWAASPAGGGAIIW